MNCVYYVNCKIFLGCLMLYFSNSFLIVSYKCDTRFRFLMLTANQVGLCLSLCFVLS